MGLIYAITSAVLLWLVLWALGMKSFDAILISAGVMVLATAVWKVLSYFPNADTEVAPSNDA
ncbi:unannotated protein [freshwater metagenome]|uniref:Unannotated protein n=1 Tax=freshwater metagenome TaxID=449393 RepID=A0A6J7GHW1_9ZZZZ|nr:hypothetical protein [Actinomycetota bacterium]